MKKLLSLNLVIASAIFVTGCAGAHKMPLNANKGSLAKVSNPVGLFTLRTENAYKPSIEPKVALIKTVANGSRVERLFAAPKPYKQVSGQYLEYLCSVDLEPGDYSLGQVLGVGTSFLIQGNFDFPLKTRFSLSSGVTYLGNVTMVNRKRNEGEERSGRVFPLVDQAVCGFYEGTFDVTVTDRSETDIPAFLEAYPALKGVNITTKIMEK